jgi:nitric oxide reductase large subunit
VFDPDGRILFTRVDITAGQGTFLRNGLMEYGFIFGHSAYFGPDYTADYLNRAAQMSMPIIIRHMPVSSFSFADIIFCICLCIALR